MKFLSQSFFALSYILISQSAFAEDRGFYLGGSVGYSVIDTYSASELDALYAGEGVTTTNTRVDDDDIGWKLLGGYNINQYFSVELAYVDLGEVESNSEVTAPSSGSAKIKAAADGFSLAGVAQYPVRNNLDVFAKAGAFFWEVDGDGSYSVSGITNAASTSEDGTDFMFGFGAEYEFTQRLGLRAEWERYDVDGDDADLFTVGLEFDF